ISPKQWSQFWKIRLTPPARNTWFRLIHNKWPSMTRLNHFMPSTYPSPHCQYCFYPSQDTRHLAINCPSRLQVWQAIWSLLLPTHPFDPDIIWYSLLFFHNSPDITTISHHHWHQFLGMTLHAIWTAHWANIFDNVPFSPSYIIKTVSASLS
ncbi:hypothetical protein BCR42DRAFT_308216, partial [Absidia repens]